LEINNLRVGPKKTSNKSKCSPVEHNAVQCRCGPTGYFAKMGKKNTDGGYILTAMILRLAKTSRRLMIPQVHWYSLIREPYPPLVTLFG
jgi:hypothetical protein